MSASKRNVQENPEDMRMKKCNLCKKLKSIHKYDCFCDACKGSASNIKRKNGSIFK
jgi:Zn finger protein HypA/HybF involved in hydrogenase expression